MTLLNQRSVFETPTINIVPNAAIAMIPAVGILVSYSFCFSFWLDVFPCTAKRGDSFLQFPAEELVDHFEFLFLGDPLLLGREPHPAILLGPFPVIRAPFATGPLLHRTRIPSSFRSIRSRRRSRSLKAVRITLFRSSATSFRTKSSESCFSSWIVAFVSRWEAFNFA